MNKIYFIVPVMFISLLSYSQEVNNQSTVDALPSFEDSTLYNTAGIDKKPEYPDGLNEFYKYIAKNYKTPQVAGLQGKVFVTFVIEKDGNITDVKVLRDIGYGTGEEAVRVLKNCKNWIPGEKAGKKVRVLYSLPIAIQTK